MKNISRIKWIEILCRIAANLTLDGNVGNQYRTTACHSLKRGQSEAFVQRREDEAGGLIIETYQFVVAHPA